jgi:integrase
MGTIYARGRKLWIGYKDAEGTRKYAPTKFVLGQESKARKLLEAIERRVKAAGEFGEASLGPLTVKRYIVRWIEDRRLRQVASADDDETRLQRHALPELGELVLADVRPSHVRALVRKLKAKVGQGREQLAPRTVRHVYGVLHRMFEDAVADELIESNPCSIRRGELPAKVDKDPTWRSGAVFAREEVEQLISDDRIPEDRRVFYAIALLGGLRTGEVSALRFRAYDASLEPLGRLLVAASFDTRTRLEKGVKTGKPREVPIHPTLAKVLAAWKLTGWRRMMGRSPGPDDVLVPKQDGRNRDAHFVLYWFRRDCEVLALRRRRQYDSRRTFVSLAQADGARKDILRWITHGPDGDIVSVYTTLPWNALCEEVAKLRIGLRDGQLIQLQNVASVRRGHQNFTTPVTTDTARQSKTLSISRTSNSAASVPDGIRTLFRQLN